MSIVLVGIGGVFGALSRYKLGILISDKSNTRFPLGTFIINVSGAILLGILISIHAEKNIYLLFGDGFLGAYTTFSTFMYEGFDLFRESTYKEAFVYIFSTALLGILGYIIGFEVGSLL